MLNVPKKLTAGIGADWYASHPDYRSDQWNLVLNIAGNILVPTTTTPQADGWLVEIDGADTTDEAGNYYWSARVVSVESGVARSIGAGNLVMEPDLATVDEPYDGRTQAKKIHDGLLTAIAEMSSGKIASYSIEGRSASYRSLEELNKAEAYWRQRVLDEEAKQTVANGGANPRVIRTRFYP